MPLANPAPAYLQDLASVQGGNASTDYFRYQNEVEKQKREREAEMRKRGSFGQRMVRGLGGALKGGLMGAMTMNPYAAAGGAAAGFAGGALDDGSGQQNIGNTIGQVLPMAAMAGARYMGGAGGGEAVAESNAAGMMDTYGRDLTQNEWDMLRRQNGLGSGWGGY